MEGWGPGEAYPLKLDKLPNKYLSNVALLFGGVGDGSFTSIREQAEFDSTDHF